MDVTGRIALLVHISSYNNKQKALEMFSLFSSEFVLIRGTSISSWHDRKVTSTSATWLLEYYQILFLDTAHLNNVSSSEFAPDPASGLKIFDIIWFVCYTAKQPNLVVPSTSLWINCDCDVPWPDKAHEPRRLWNMTPHLHPRPLRTMFQPWLATQYHLIKSKSWMIF